MDSDILNTLCQIGSFIFIPYLAIVIFNIPYFAYQKYLIHCQIKNIPATTIFATDLSKVKKNLQIKSLIHTFILIIYSFEAITFLLTTISSIYLAFKSLNATLFQDVVIRNKHTNQSCTLRKSTNFGAYIYITQNIAFLFPIVINLFVIVLRRVYLNVPYRRWVIGYSGYYLFRLVFLICSAHFIFTNYLLSTLELPFFFFDIHVYVKASKKFYLLLKGMSEEAKWHSTSQEFENKRRAAKLFAITRMLVLFTIIILITLLLLHSILELTTIVNHSSCIIQYIFPNTQISFTVQNSTTTILMRISFYIRILQTTSDILIGLIVFVLNLAILLWIIRRLIIRRKSYIHVNDWITRPLMERYRADVGRNYDRRPPFIQAFRSQLIY